MRLNETEMVKLLPAWMQEDGSDKGLATGCDIISRDAYARLKLLSRWDKIDQLNDAELDEMAWELNIQWYDSTAPIAVKRAVIRSSDRVYAKLGTPYAVEQIVSDYLGTPIQMYDEKGNKTWDCTLDIYGKVITVNKGMEFDCPFKIGRAHV